MGPRRAPAPAPVPATAMRGQALAMTILEVDPASEDPALLDTIRKKNSAALTSILDPSDEPSGKDSSNAADVVWFLITNGNHITGNLNLLADLTPVFDRWVRALVGPPMQVYARGSVNYKGINLRGVWYVPDCTVNVVSVAQLTNQEYAVTMGGGACSIRRFDMVVGEGRLTGHLYELDYINTASFIPWYIVSNAAEHMTGNLDLLMNFTPTRPGRPIRTHTGMMLQVCGRGSVGNNHLAVLGISYVPGITENIISLSQLTDSGFNVTFGPDGCTVARNRDGVEVGKASYAGGQLYQINFLRVAPSPSPSK